MRATIVASGSRSDYAIQFSANTACARCGCWKSIVAAARCLRELRFASLPMAILHCVRDLPRSTIRIEVSRAFYDEPGWIRCELFMSETILRSRSSTAKTVRAEDCWLLIDPTLWFRPWRDCCTSGRPGALRRRAPLRTGRARFRASGSSKPWQVRWRDVVRSARQGACRPRVRSPRRSSRRLTCPLALASSSSSPARLT
jgi:hypothetical protein